jgi:uncharacterized protein (DUF2062 family)/trans-aconitate methyltransferase
MPLRPHRLTAALYRYRTEGNTPVRQAFAVGLGLYIGATPFIGFHLLLSVGLGWLFGLNRLKVYLAANISNPLIAPFLYTAEFAVGAWLRTGHISTSDLQALRWHGIALDLLVGSVVIGVVLATIGGVLTYWTVASGAADRETTALVDATAERYLPSGIGAWELARGKMRMDPVYLRIVRNGRLPSSGRVLDLGCGPGYLLALLATARDRFARGLWPASWPAPPTDLSLRGIDVRPKVVQRARVALGGDATIDALDVSTQALPGCDVIVLLDVLHLLPRAGQDHLLQQAASALPSGGLLIIREADANGGWRFLAVRSGNRLIATLHGHPMRRFAFDSLDGWRQRLVGAGFDIEVVTDEADGVFANVLIQARRPLDVVDPD